jgi:hypothetical protein
MMNICFNCGEYRADKVIDPEGPYATCPLCGFKHRFLRLPLLLVGGPSGTGKTAIYQKLVGTMDRVVLLDHDILWRSEFNTPESHYRDFFETWLRICNNVSQAGRPVVLFGTGTCVPENLEPCVERRYFSDLHYLGLVCDEDILTERLRSRPKWRKCSDPPFIASQMEFNQWLKGNADTVEPRIELLDTSRTSVEEASEGVASWIRGKVS